MYIREDIVSPPLRDSEGYLTICSTNMTTSSQDIQASIKKIHPIVNNTSVNLSAVVNSLPAILEHLVVIDQELRNLRKQGNSSLDSTLNMQLEPVLQHLAVHYFPSSL